MGRLLGEGPTEGTSARGLRGVSEPCWGPGEGERGGRHGQCTDSEPEPGSACCREGQEDGGGRRGRHKSRRRPGRRASQPGRERLALIWSGGRAIRSMLSPSPAAVWPRPSSLLSLTHPRPWQRLLSFCQTLSPEPGADGSRQMVMTGPDLWGISWSDHRGR